MPNVDGKAISPKCQRLACKMLPSPLNSALCINDLEQISRVVAILELNFYTLILWDHLVLELPSSALAQFSHNHIAVAKHIDIEVHMRYRLLWSAVSDSCRQEQGLRSVKCRSEAHQEVRSLRLPRQVLLSARCR